VLYEAAAASTGGIPIFGLGDLLIVIWLPPIGLTSIYVASTK
jgi:hypothetical protein